MSQQSASISVTPPLVLLFSNSNSIDMEDEEELMEDTGGNTQFHNRDDVLVFAVTARIQCPSVHKHQVTIKSFGNYRAIWRHLPW